VSHRVAYAGSVGRPARAVGLLFSKCISILPSRKVKPQVKHSSASVSAFEVSRCVPGIVYAVTMIHQSLEKTRMVFGRRLASDLSEKTFESEKFILWSTAVFIALALFPMGWLAQQWPFFERVTDFIFGTEAMHVVGHLVLFAGMGTAVLTIFPRLQTYPRFYFALMFSFGFVQETLQLISFKHHFFGGNELLDLAVDLLAASVVWQIIKRRSNHD
jgi:hypothetical protein